MKNREKAMSTVMFRRIIMGKLGNKFNIKFKPKIIRKSFNIILLNCFMACFIEFGCFFNVSNWFNTSRIFSNTFYLFRNKIIKLLHR